MSVLQAWTPEAVPLSADIEEYLAHVQAVRNVFPGLPGLPEVPPDLAHFSFEGANDIERILSMIDGAISRIPPSRVYAGEFISGGV